MEVCSGVRGVGRLPANPQLPRLARQTIGRHIHFAVNRASARIRLSLRINISLTIGEIYKMVKDFSTQFSPLFLFMKYLAIISRHPVYLHLNLIDSILSTMCQQIYTYKKVICNKNTASLCCSI